MKNFIKSKPNDGRINLLDCKYNEKNYEMVFTNTGIEFSEGNNKKEISLTKQHQHSHQVYHIILFTEGSYHYFYNNRKHAFSPGTLTITSPGELHRFGPYTVKEDSTYYFLTFQLEDSGSKAPLDIPFHKLLEIYTDENIADIRFPVKLGKRQTIFLQNTIIKIAELLNSKDNLSRFSAGLTTLEIFNFLLNECFSAEKTGLNAPKEIFHIEKAKEYIEKNFTENITIADLASVASLAPNYLIRKFKKEYHTTPINYQLELKVNAAKTLLTTTDFQVKRIANEVGFNDIYYFSRKFKKQTGMTPKEFRNSMLDT